MHLALRLSRRKETSHWHNIAVYCCSWQLRTLTKVCSILSANAKPNMNVAKATSTCSQAPRPASFADRLAMMTLFAQDLLSEIYNTQTNNSQTPPIDIGIIKHARFLDKATALRNAYPNIDEMIFLTGFDTLYRFFDPVYYGGRLEPLAPFFEGGNRIQCFYRPYTSVHQESTQWKREQERYVEKIKEGNMEAQGCLRKWGEKIELVVSINTPDLTRRR